MCTDFTSLNKACPKDFYLLPCLGRLVDGSAGHEIFDFMDASRCYHQIGRNMEIYVDDMLVKSKEKGHHLVNFKETFEQLRSSRLRINLEKCSFGVTLGKFLGYMMRERGIKPNPDKIKALLNMEPLAGYKDIQKLTGCLEALSRFISKSGEQNLPFLKNLRRASKEAFSWDEECAQAFNELKEYLASPKLLS
ncbi:hypothetical protein LIER_20243 [Lithospermum erythrorhizon]|uniref:Reverse transcriptase domain-containing protein n=1 Tax=Lithospermum erythrorhizon TaxID=34254 RepID=A0AAV3QN11_LITER